MSHLTDVPAMLLLLLLLLKSGVVDRAAAECDFDHRWSYEVRPCSGWSVHDDDDNDDSSNHFVLLTGSQVSTDNITGSLLPLVDHSEGTESGTTLPLPDLLWNIDQSIIHSFNMPLILIRQLNRIRGSTNMRCFATVTLRIIP